MAGAAMVVIGLVGLGVVSGSLSTSRVAGFLALAGTGLGFCNVVMQTVVLQTVKADQAGVASGIYMIVRYIGTILSSALIDLTIGERMTASAFRGLLGVLMVVSVLAMFLTFGVRDNPQEQRN